MNGIPLRDHYARQIVGSDAAEDCMKTPQKYNVNIFNFTQPQDHFDPNNNITWQQQVQWRNDSFKSQDSGDIIFLLLGGEGPIQTTWICFTNYTWTKLAQQHNAFMFQLEHRYFGTSAPTSDMSVANLKWLTTEQAMADLNQFIPAMNKQFGFNKPKWVAFGGSYPGTLAALLRMSYPNITNGNIASSAPLWAKVDMWEYAEKMDQAILWTSQNNASLANCHSETQKAFIYAKNATYYDTGRAELNKAFNITPPLGTNPNTTMNLDATNFLRTIFHSFQGIIQYTFDNRGNATINANGLNVNSLCVRMVDTSKSLVERLYSVYAWEQSWDSGLIPSSLNNDYWAGIAFARNTQFGSDAAAWRGWMWLCCNEFGWLPTTDNTYTTTCNIVVISSTLLLTTIILQGCALGPDNRRISVSGHAIYNGRTTRTTDGTDKACPRTTRTLTTRTRLVRGRGQDGTDKGCPGTRTFFTEFEPETIRLESGSTTA
uniref:Uncharacterized protein n=1 Tax=Acrobeloides nanus TaxID=290746 RepID=A0A914DMP7_9BILA